MRSWTRVIPLPTRWNFRLPLLPHLGRRRGWLFILIQVIHGSCLELQGVNHDIGFGSKVIWETSRTGGLGQL